ncbi:substrate-binding domain-containing protein [Bradyrhizobium sp. OAE829]|uniref:substrate-binding domain-containing protein n=1 Tax=Bradyrhizobium sp. OAE829 TaxID=2663807 RepID=UPI0017890DEA
MFKRSVSATFAVAAFSSLLLVATMPSPARAAEIELLGPVSLRIVLPGLLQQFESSGHTVKVGYATLGVITKRFIEGEAVDVAMVSPEQNEDLQKRGKLLAGSRAEIARVGFAVFVKKDAPNPDVASVDALKRTLLAAKSIVLGDPAAGGGAGVYTAGLMERLGQLGHQTFQAHQAGVPEKLWADLDGDFRSTPVNGHSQDRGHVSKVRVRFS